MKLMFERFIIVGLLQSFLGGKKHSIEMSVTVLFRSGLEVICEIDLLEIGRCIKYHLLKCSVNIFLFKFTPLGLASKG